MRVNHNGWRTLVPRHHQLDANDEHDHDDYAGYEQAEEAIHNGEDAFLIVQYREWRGAVPT